MELWMIVTVEGEPDWPSSEKQIDFNGKSFILRPIDGDSAADIRTRYLAPQEEVATFNAICMLLSSMAWWQRRPIRARYRISCSTAIRGRIHSSSPLRWDDFHLNEIIQSPTDIRVQLAIALYREALSLSNTPYEFLGYMKIINILHSSGSNQKKWINNTLTQLSDISARNRINELRVNHKDIGQYLYESGRCAIAHAHGTPVINPDMTEDMFRLSKDMPIARSLAEYIIEFELGVPWRGSNL